VSANDRLDKSTCSRPVTAQADAALQHGQPVSAPAGGGRDEAPSGDTRSRSGPSRLGGVCDLSPDELADWCQAVGQPAYRATQILHWVYHKRQFDPDRMLDLPRAFRQRVADELPVQTLRPLRHWVSSDGTEKLLLETADGRLVECVLMREQQRRTACISTQVGCAMGCVFCASGLKGLERNLTRGEILQQLLQLQRLLPEPQRLTNVVVMGMGEPLANWDELVAALERITDAKHGLGLSPRRVTISTVGLPDRIRQLAELGWPVTLAVSLHAPNDRLRNELVRVNRGIGIRSILEATDEYFAKTGRRVSFEYVLIKDVNDRPTHARQLAALLSGRNAHVNLIPLNRVSELRFQPPSARSVREFAAVLERKGVTVTVRKRKGADIDAACGQLRLRHQRRVVVEQTSR